MGGDNTLGYKAYARATIEKHPRSEDDSKITFKYEEMKYLDSNHDDAIVVSIRMINA